MAQWQACKAQAPNALLLFRLGDFFEAFHEDAKICARELELTLTHRQQVPMSGIPAHTLDSYIDKLLVRGYRVAIADQIEAADQAKGLVRREITRIVTPGSLTHSSLLREKSNNYLVAITQVGQMVGLAFVDLTTAECRTTELETTEALIDELERLQPAEILLAPRFLKAHPNTLPLLKALAPTQEIETWRFEHDWAYRFLLQTLQVQSLDGFGLQGKIAAINAAGALLSYAHEVLLHDIHAIHTVLPYTHHQVLSIDAHAIRHLEILAPQRPSPERPNCLLSLLDATITPMGGRLLRRWIVEPLTEVNAIKARQEAIAALIPLLNDLYPLLEQIRDIQRLAIKAHRRAAGPKDLLALAHSLTPIQPLQQLLLQSPSPFVQQLSSSLKPLEPLVDALKRAIQDPAPLRVSDGGAIRTGYNVDLDQWRSLAQDSQTWMAHYQQKLRDETGIKTLKVGYTAAFGFYIEVSRLQAEKIGPSFQRRQTLTNAERYTTPELREWEDKILHAQEEISSLEQQLFSTLISQVNQEHETLIHNSQNIALIDCLFSLAQVAKQRNYICPDIDASDTLTIEEGRHPVIEALGGIHFIPNDTYLNSQEQRLLLITGPNMAGKSTYIRQVALLVLMAQIGSFIPAKRAHIGVVDKILTRIGASDDLARGQSTFMVEMTETARILHQATDRSLIILDEIGRGTSTYDGLSLAWAIAEHLLLATGKQAKTLFATHYGELTQLASLIPGAVNYTVAVHEAHGEISFLHKIIPGVADRSYGLHVAKLAGVPSSVLSRAEHLLKQFEQPAEVKRKRSPPSPSPTQLVIF